MYVVKTEFLSRSYVYFSLFVEMVLSKSVDLKRTKRQHSSKVKHIQSGQLSHVVRYKVT